jgi:hypothetical protein
MKTRSVLLPVLALLLCLLPISCNEELDSAIRYDCISIPGYGMSDYLALLDAKDADQVYNAICNLASSASNVGTAINEGAPADGSENHEEELNEEELKEKEKALKDYETMRAVYAGIQKTLQATSLKVRLASVHFIKLMGAGCNKTDELVKLLLTVKSGNDFLDFELVSALSYLCSLDAIAGEKYIRAFLASPSWLVSRAAYGLVDANRNTALRRELIGKYKAERDEKEKLLLLTSISSSYENEFAAFIVGELTKTGDDKIRQTLLGILVNPAEIAPCIALIDEQYSNFSAPVIASLAENNIYGKDLGSDFRQALVILFIRKNYNFLGDLAGSEVKLFRDLYNGITELDKKKETNDSDKTKKENLVAIEKSLIENPALAAGWKEYKAMRSKLDNKPWIEQYQSMAKEFLKKTGKLLEENKVEEWEKIISEMEMILKLPEQALPQGIDSR